MIRKRLVECAASAASTKAEAKMRQPSKPEQRHRGGQPRKAEISRSCPIARASRRAACVVAGVARGSDSGMPAVKAVCSD